MTNFDANTISVNDVLHTLRECERNERYDGMFEHMLAFASELTGLSEDALMESMYKDEPLLREEPVGERDWFYNNPESNEFFCVYFNPDSSAGGEYVQMSLPYHLILNVAKETGQDSKAFFDFLDAKAHTEHVSIDSESFKAQMEHYRANPPDFVRDFVHEDGTDAMLRLVKTALIYRSLDLDGDELKAYKEALKHYAADANGVEHIEGVAPLKLIYCHEHGKDLMDFDFWCQFEHLVGEEISYDEFQAINETFDGDPHDIEEDDLEAVAQFKEALLTYREEKPEGAREKGSLDQKIEAAKAKANNREKVEDRGLPEIPYAK